MSSDVLNHEKSLRKEEKRRLRKEEKKEKKEHKRKKREERINEDAGVEENVNGKREAHKKRKRHSKSEVDEQERSSKKSRQRDGRKMSGIEESSLESSDQSPFYNQTSSFYLPISPISLAQPLEGLCAEHLSPLILTYHPLFRAVILSYSNVRLGEQPTTSTSTEPVLAKSIDEYAVSFVWVTADFLLFNPQKGDRIEGHVNLQDKSHVGLVCWNLFNASIERKRLPKTWAWKAMTSRDYNIAIDNHTEPVGSQSRAGETSNGYYEDEQGLALEGKITFRVKDAETSSGKDKGFLSIEGTLLTNEEEEALVEEEKASLQSRFSGGGRTQDQPRGLGGRRLGRSKNLLEVNHGSHNKNNSVNY
jgi:DNA-directed RNA polymerase I subunit RPA43